MDDTDYGWLTRLLAAFLAVIVIYFTVHYLWAAAATISDDPALAFTVEIPGQAEDWGPDFLIATGFRRLGATASCPGECLVYIDPAGTEVHIRFRP
jgi:hypothetical protein